MVRKCKKIPVKFVNNKAKGRISKRVLQENKARQIHVCVSGGKKCSFFGKFGVLCFLVTPVATIRPSAVLQTNCSWGTSIEDVRTFLAYFDLPLPSPLICRCLLLGDLPTLPLPMRTHSDHQN